MQKPSHLRSSRTLNERRKAAREKFMEKKKKIFAPYSDGWFDIARFQNLWKNICDAFLGLMKCCSICGNVTFSNQKKDMKAKNMGRAIPPYAIANTFMWEYTYADDTQTSWHTCPLCKAYPDRIKYIVFFSPTYIQTILKIHVSNLQLLSVIDVSVDVTRRVNSFVTGHIEKRSLFDNLIACNLSRCDKNHDTVEIRNVLEQNVLHNPIL